MVLYLTTGAHVAPNNLARADMGVAKSGVHRRLLRIVNNPKIYRIRHDDLGLTLSSPSAINPRLLLS